ncbi:hypothetical protein [uncultured Croceitalea sp.]|uniref:hypothetical protein n=1 Tax=uncultured Croceitalea sp. TaxID=1798908 RepID=UPI0033064996
MVSAQEVDVNYGYQFGTKFSGKSDYLSIDAGKQLGISLGWLFSDNTVAQITYNRHISNLLIKDQDVSPIESTLADFTSNWVMLNVMYYFVDGNITPFIGGGGGYAFVSFENENTDVAGGEINSVARIACSLKGGITFWVTNNLGFKLQGDLFIPFNGFNLEAIFEEDNDGLKSAENLRFISPYAGLNAGVVIRI